MQPITMLTTSVRGPTIAEPFTRLGAIARYVPLDLLTSVLREGSSSPLIAEAIIIDGSADGMHENALLRAIGLANAVRALPDHTAMQNGIRWRHIPITIVVESDEFVDRTRGDPAIRNITVCSAHRGWHNVYRATAANVNAFGLRLVEELRSIGWQLREERDRIYRVNAPKGMTRKTADHFETELYFGTADRWFQSRSQRNRLPLEVVLADPRVAEYDIERLRELTYSKGLLEGIYQHFFDYRPYIFGAAPHELLPKPTLPDPDLGINHEPDYSVDRLTFSEHDPAPYFMEIKVPDIDPALVRARGFKKFAGEITTGIRQVRGVQELAKDPRLAAHLDNIFSSKRPVGPGVLIAGIRGKANAAAFDQERAFVRESLHVRAYDEVLEYVEKTYLAEHRDEVGPYGIERLGLPGFEMLDIDRPRSFETTRVSYRRRSTQRRI